MAASLVQAVNGSGATNTIAVTGVAAGSLLVTVARVGALGATVTVADNVNGAWTQAVAQAQSTDGHTGYIFYRENSAAGSLTVTLTTSGGSTRLVFSEWSGVFASGSLGNTNSAQAGAYPLPSGTVTANDGDLVLGGMTNQRVQVADYVAGGTGGTWTICNSYSEAEHSVASQYVVGVGTGVTYESAPSDNGVTFVNQTSMIAQFRAAGAIIYTPISMPKVGR